MTSVSSSLTPFPTFPTLPSHLALATRLPCCSVYTTKCATLTRALPQCLGPTLSLSTQGVCSETPVHFQCNYTPLCLLGPRLLFLCSTLYFLLCCVPMHGVHTHSGTWIAVSFPPWIVNCKGGAVSASLVHTLSSGPGTIAGTHNIFVLNKCPH